MKSTLILVLVASLGLAACSKKEEPIGQAPGMAVGQMQNAGRVIQVIQAGTYTYVEAEVGGGEKLWMAGAHIEVKQGDTIQWGQGGMMQNFVAKSLNRTFERILFVESWAAGGKAAAVAAHGSMQGAQQMVGQMPGGHPPMGNMGGAAQGGANSGVVKSVANAGGYSYVEVQQGSGSLWIAAPETQVKVGDKVTWDGGSLMQNFTARSLNRTFDQIVFAGGVSVVK